MNGRYQLKRTISFSELSTFLACTQRWSYAYEDRLQARADAEPLLLGSIVHAGLAAGLRYYALCDRYRQRAKERLAQVTVERACNVWATGYLAEREMWDEEREVVRAKTDTGFRIALRALNWLQPERWETLWLGRVPLIEAALVAPLEFSRGLKLVVDWVARDRIDGTTWIFDHKTVRSFQDEHAAQLLQLPLYQHALSVLGMRVDGTATLQVLDRLPAVPEVTKKGTVSRANITTDWPTYRQAILDAGGDPSDYADVRTRLSSAEFFRLQRAYRPARQAEEVWDQILVPVTWLISSGRVVRIRSRSYQCSYCAYRALCDAHLSEDDAAWVQQAHYRKRKR
jgi:hypothetical protein